MVRSLGGCTYRQSKVTQGTQGLSPIAFIFHIKAHEKELKSFNNYVLLIMSNYKYTVILFASIDNWGYAGTMQAGIDWSKICITLTVCSTYIYIIL